MPKSREQKKEILRNLEEKIKKSKSIVFTSFGNLKVSESEDLRKRLKKEGGECYIPKKTLLQIALSNVGFDIKAREFEGRVAIIFGYNDQVAHVKAVDEFRKEQEDKIGFIGGILDNQFISAEKVSGLAKIPNRQELYAKLVGSLNAPTFGFVNVLSGNIRNLVFVLKAIEENKVK
ncbi:50S ribosomal protein L10 [bacterium]|nr:50S ribosomal protein L10 [bacterium]